MIICFKGLEIFLCSSGWRICDRILRPKFERINHYLRRFHIRLTYIEVIDFDALLFCFISKWRELADRGDREIMDSLRKFGSHQIVLYHVCIIPFALENAKRKLK